MYLESTMASQTLSLVSRMIGHSPCALVFLLQNFNPHVERWGSRCDAQDLSDVQATQTGGLDHGTFGQ